MNPPGTGNKVATLTAVFMSAVTLLGIIFAPNDSFDDVVELVPEENGRPRFCSLDHVPFILLVSLAALVMGMLTRSMFSARRPWLRAFLSRVDHWRRCVRLWLDPHFGARSLIGLAIESDRRIWQLSSNSFAAAVGYKYHAIHWAIKAADRPDADGPAVIAASASRSLLINSGFAARPGDGPVSW